MKEKERAQAELKKEFKKILKYTTTLYTSVTHVSLSGMTRYMDVFVIKRNQPICLNGWIAGVLGYKQHIRGELIVTGCGMDMGFSVVYNVSYCLFKNGYRLKQRWL